MLLRPLLAAAALTLLGGTTVAVVAPAGPADSVTANVATPGAFHGYGFDQCLAPTQQSMNAWIEGLLDVEDMRRRCTAHDRWMTAHPDAAAFAHAWADRNAAELTGR